MNERVASRQPRSKAIPAEEAQELILQAVDELFYREGARAVSIDEVVKRAGVNKMSLYRQFESKEALLLHYLERSDQNFWDYFNGSVAKHPGDARKQLLQFFIDLAGRAGRPGYRGCPFVNIAAEFPERDHPARLMVVRNKEQLMARLQELAGQTGARDAQVLADGLALLIEGAYAASQTYPPGHPLLAALPQVATALLSAACD
jgi:AcrR family transcriptional regulator